MKPEIIGKHGLKQKASRDAFTSVNVRYRLAFQLRAMREARGWTQTEVAEAAKTSRTCITRLESGFHVPSVSVLIRLAKVFDVALHVGFMSFTDYRHLTRDKTPEGMNAKSYRSRS